MNQFVSMLPEKGDDLFYLHKKFIGIAGLWKLEKQERWDTLLIALKTLLALLWITFGISMAVEVYNNLHQLAKVSDSACVVVFYVILLAKMTTLVVKRDTFTKLMSTTRKQFEMIDDELCDTRSGMIQQASGHCKRMVRISINGYLFILLFVFFFCISINYIQDTRASNFSNGTTNTRQPILMMHAAYPVDLSTPPNFEIVLVYQFIGGAACALYLATTDCFYTTLIHYTTTNFRILNKTLSDIAITESHDGSWKLSEMLPAMQNTFGQLHSKDDHHLSPIVRCVRLHQSLLEHAQTLSATLSYMMFVQYVMVSLSVCMGLMQALQYPVFSVEFIRGSLFALGLSCSLAVYCWYANELTIESGKTGECIYQTNWYHSSQRFKFCLRMMLLRAQRPVTFTAANFADVNLEMFTSLMQLSYSLMTVLRQVHEQ